MHHVGSLESRPTKSVGGMCRMHKVNRLHIFGLICSCSKRSPILRPSNISSLAQATFSSCDMVPQYSASTLSKADYSAHMSQLENDACAKEVKFKGLNIVLLFEKEHISP